MAAPVEEVKWQLRDLWSAEGQGGNHTRRALRACLDKRCETKDLDRHPLYQSTFPMEFQSVFFTTSISTFVLAFVP